MTIETVRDLLNSNRGNSVEYVFKSLIPVTCYGTYIYSVVEKPSKGEENLHIRPLNGRDLKLDLSETVHVPLWQHLDDCITNIPKNIKSNIPPQSA